MVFRVFLYLHIHCNHKLRKCSRYLVDILHGFFYTETRKYRTSSGKIPISELYWCGSV